MRILEVLLAGFGAIGAGWASWNWWTYLHSATYSGGSVWPLPAGYLLEITVLGVGGLVSVSANRTSSPPLWGNVTWAIAGVFLSLAVLGAWSIGPSVVPALLALVVAGILAGVRRRQKVLTQVGWFAGGAMGQAVMMLLAIFFCSLGSTKLPV